MAIDKPCIYSYECRRDCLGPSPAMRCSAGSCFGPATGLGRSGETVVGVWYIFDAMETLKTNECCLKNRTSSGNWILFIFIYFFCYPNKKRLNVVLSSSESNKETLDILLSTEFSQLMSALPGLALWGFGHLDLKVVSKGSYGSDTSSPAPEPVSPVGCRKDLPPGIGARWNWGVSVGMKVFLETTVKSGWCGFIHIHIHIHIILNIIYIW